MEWLTRAVQPALWLLVFREVFTRTHALPTGSVLYLNPLTCEVDVLRALMLVQGKGPREAAAPPPTQSRGTGAR
jgi:hypothetical protein